MSPRNLVLPLNFISLRTVSSLLIHALSDDEGSNHEAVTQYLSNTTYAVLQDLLKNILNTEYLDASTRFSCLQVILREDIRKLDTGVFPHSYHSQILEVIALKGTGLRHLNLKGVWVRDQTEKLSELINKLKHLKYLYIPHMVDDLVLKAINNCKQLTILDISGECTFTCSGLERLISDKIKILDLGYYGKEDVCEGEYGGHDIVALLIKNLPNLVALKTYSYAGKALLYLHNKNNKYKTRLKYIHDSETNVNSLNAIVNCCPDLEVITLNKPDDGVLKELHKLNNLHSLKLSRVKYKEMIEYLKLAGNKVQELKLNVIKEDSVDLSVICQMAPELITLECFKMNLTCKQFNNISFINLQSIEVLYCELNMKCLRFLLTNTKCLKRIIIGDVVHMTDGDIFRLCADCEFSYLEELWFSCAKGLTATSVELLMGHCPNLKVLGQLSGWDVTPNDMDYLRAAINCMNIDLTLLPVGGFP